MAGGRSETQANTTNQQITTTTVGDIGLTGQDAVQITSILGQTSNAGASRLLDSVDRFTQLASVNANNTAALVNSTETGNQAGISSNVILYLVIGAVLLGVLS